MSTHTLESFPIGPDENAAGLLSSPPARLRYDHHALDPDEVGGIVCAMIPRAARILDVGCGTGALSVLLRDTRGAEVVGIEPDLVRAERAIARGLDVRIGCLTRDLLGDLGVFDVVLFADVLEHLPDPHAALLVARDFLREGGSAVVSVPNVAHWSVRAEILQGRFRYQSCGIMDATHLRWLTLATAKTLIETAGFKVIRQRSTAGLDAPDNLFRAPLCWLRPAFRNRLLRSGCRHWPTLFGCQHVLKAQKHD